MKPWQETIAVILVGGVVGFAVVSFMMFIGKQWEAADKAQAAECSKVAKLANATENRITSDGVCLMVKDGKIVEVKL